MSGNPASRRRRKWKVVDQVVLEGVVYQLRQRPAEPPDLAPRLTRREEQVLSVALAGESNKGIAFTLGLAPSTVGVLLFRAATKFGVRTRRELLSAYVNRKSER